MLDQAITPEASSRTAIMALENKLANLQQQIRQRGISAMVMFEGWGASGKGTMVARLIRSLDPRGYKVYSITAPSQEDMRFPPMRRIWTKTPSKGQIVIFDRGWYREVSLDHVEENLSLDDQDKHFEHIQYFEKQLTDSGCVLLKFFLHISKKEQKKRLTRLKEEKATRWRVTEADWRHNKQYEDYYQAFDRMLERTQTPWAPWHVVANKDQDAAAAYMLQTVITALETALENKPPVVEEPPLPPSTLLKIPPLATVDLNRNLEKAAYSMLLNQGQERLIELHNKLYRKRVPLIICYEGWDAAGKGGNIKRMTQSMDPRGYEVVPISAPNQAESAHHYLWRFWNNLPKDGHIAIFDRSWYGRVMVERIEGFCTPAEWMRSYEEINQFEKELADWGAVIIKFWLQISKDEQLLRFNLRQQEPDKQWKITPEDWRNREKWDSYETAVDDMLLQTNTQWAPWTIVESNDKRFARIKTIQTVIQALEKRL